MAEDKNHGAEVDEAVVAELSTSTEAILESISDGVFTVNLRWEVTSFNRAAEEITGVPREEALGRPCSEVFRSSLCGPGCALRQTLEGGKAIIGKACTIIDPEGRRVPISVSTAIMRDAAGRILGGAETFRDLSEIEALRQEVSAVASVGELRSHSPEMQKIFAMLTAVAASPSTVLIEGETGTGKEVIARTLHALSPWSRGPFVAVNCAALPDNLLESELFGYKAGAFTGASRDKIGRFAMARGGTLFLDEIAEISPYVQAKLLRVLQERVYEPLGATRSESSDARIVAATNRDLAAMVREGRFREDLFYRINVVRIALPPLARRIEDVPLLAHEIIGELNRRQGRKVPGLQAQALEILMAYHWPGNVRELANVMERAFILCGERPIDAQDLPPELLAQRPPTPLRRGREELEAAQIQAALARHGNNRSAAAKSLGIHKSTLFRRVKALGLTLPVTDGRQRRRRD